MKRVIELVRVSTEGQAGEDRAGIPAQRAANRRTAQQYCLEIVRTIEMVDVSGAAVLSAPEMQELFRLMASPDIQGVVTKEFSRLMRPGNYADYAILQQFVDTGTVLYLPDGPLDPAGDSGQLIGPLRAAIAGWERRAILDRIWRAKEEKRKRGELAQSPNCLPYGVGYENGKFFYKPEAEKVREAYRRVLSGDHNYNAIAELLGVTHRGAHVILRNPIWTGWRVIDKKRDPSAAGKLPGADGRQGDRRKIRRPDSEIIRVRVITDPVVSEADFARAQAIMDAKQANHWRNREGYVHRFTYNGFLSCACGEPLHTFRRRADYYICRDRRAQGSCRSSYLRREKVEAQLDTLFTERLTDEGFLREIAEHTRQQVSGNGDSRRIAQAHKQLATIEGQRERAIECYVSGMLSAAKRDAKLAALESDRKLYQAVVAQKPQAAMDAAELAELFSVFYEWRFLARDDKRAILSTMMPEIRIVDGEPDRLTILGRCNEDTRSPAVSTTI